MLLSYMFERCGHPANVICLFASTAVLRKHICLTHHEGSAKRTRLQTKATPLTQYRQDIAMPCIVPELNQNTDNRIARHRGTNLFTTLRPSPTARITSHHHHKHKRRLRPQRQTCPTMKATSGYLTNTKPTLQAIRSQPQQNHGTSCKPRTNPGSARPTDLPEALVSNSAYLSIDT